MLKYPGFNPIAFQLGPVKVHWYGIMYLLGFAAAWWLARRRARRGRGSTWKPSRRRRSDLLLHARRHPRRPHRLRAVLRPEVLGGRSVVSAQDLGGRHVLPRRPARGDRGDDAVCLAPRAATSAMSSTSPRRCRRSGSSSGASATSSTASCGARRPRVPWGFKVERPGAPSFAAVRGRARGTAAVRGAVVVHLAAAAAARAVRRCSC